MNIIYLSSSCSVEKFEELVAKGITKKLPQAQKYHQLLLEGLADIIDGEIYAISAYPTNRRWTKQVIFSREEETIDNIHYIYGSFLNLPILRQLTRYNQTIKEIKKIYSTNKDCVIVCDVLNQSLADAARKCGNKLNIPVIGIVTDVPGHRSDAERKTLSFINRIISSISRSHAKKTVDKYDGYLLLTEAMNSAINKNHKPYIVMEGHCDFKMSYSDNSISNKKNPKIAMYAGGIHKEYGIARLVSAFLNGNFANWELHIYGDGNYNSELTQICKDNPQIKYFGVAPNQIVVEKQLEASLLINPRPTDEDYVKYSFPSKTMECMASGTPLLTTRLPGMPPEYYDYVYFIDDESEAGIQKALARVIEIPADELHSFGAKAKDFIINEKNNIAQAKKFVDFIETICQPSD